ncbi:MAG: hypothetical protein ACUVRD_03980 [Bacteroidia bacterium]
MIFHYVFAVGVMWAQASVKVWDMLAETPVVQEYLNLKENAEAHAMSLLRDFKDTAARKKALQIYESLMLRMTDFTRYVMEDLVEAQDTNMSLEDYIQRYELALSVARAMYEKEFLPAYYQAMGIEYQASVRVSSKVDEKKWQEFARLIQSLRGKATPEVYIAVRSKLQPRPLEVLRKN